VVRIDIQSIEDMLAILKSNPNVLGLVEYGSPHESDNYETGDYDLFVILQDKANDVESLHFYIKTISVDLNVRSLHEIQGARYVEGFSVALLDGRVIYDPTKQVSQELQKLRERQKRYYHGELSEHSIAFTRHGHRHVFNKVKGRLDTMPVLSRFLLNTNIYWLVGTYFSVRNLPFEGEKHAIDYLERNEPEIYQGIKDFYQLTSLRQQVEIAKKLTELVLRPVGGEWKDDEVLAFGGDETKDLQNKGKELFEELFVYSGSKSRGERI
jgi:hypothetical protein